MGRRWNKKKKQGGEASNQTKVEKPKRDRSDPQGYVVAKKENKDFETYYKLQNLVPEEEWKAFMESLQSSLPAAFRITGNTTQAEALLKILKEDFFQPLENLSPEELLPAAATNQPCNEGGTADSGADAQGEAVDAEEPIVPLEPKCLTWYPKGLAYQLNLSRRSIRRCEAYWRLHQCLITETDAGSISRQEAVSMIPPLLLDVQPHHNVLDMCAAPGSKTAQLIEQLHSSPDPVRGAIPPGVVVANDADNKRCYLLTHQAKRLQSPSIVITNHDASFMPNMFFTKPDGSTGKLKYDRILCDVPCSGDGTLRKNCDVWSKWNPINGSNLHGLQLRIARRGLELLAVGGRLVYSTCSLSPMENEAVLQRLLLEAAGTVTIVDCKDALPGLKYRPGLTAWSVVTKDMEVIPSPADIPTKCTNVYHKHLFPTQDKELHLERCLRLLPHHQDTGGFFVAVLEKNAPLPWEKVVGDTASVESGASQRAKPPPKKRRRQGFKEEPYYYLSDNIASWEKDYRDGKVTEPVTAPSKVSTAPETVAEEMDASEASAEAARTSGENGAEGNEAVPSSEEAKSSDPAGGDIASAPESSSSTAASSNDNQEDLRLWSSICTFFGWRKDIPEASYANFMTRSKEGKKRNLYFTNTLVRDLIDRNQDRMKIINTGVKVLVRTDNKGAVCDFRLAQEGIQSIVPLISKRRVQVTRNDLMLLLNDDDNELPPDLANMSQSCRDQSKDMVTGSVLLEYHGAPTVEEDQQSTAKDEDKIKIELVGWKGKSSMRCYVARNDRIHYLRLLRADTSKYVKNKFVSLAARTQAYLNGCASRAADDAAAAAAAADGAVASPAGKGEKEGAAQADQNGQNVSPMLVDGEEASTNPQEAGISSKKVEATAPKGVLGPGEGIETD